MNNWQAKLDLIDVWNKDWDDSNVGELGQIVATRLRKLLPESVIEEHDLEGMIGGFEYVVEIEEFDMYMQELYDFADDQRIWIATNF